MGLFDMFKKNDKILPDKNIEFNKFYTIKKQILKESAITFFTKIKINSGTYNNGIISVLDIGLSKEISEVWSWKFNNVFIPIIITSFGDMFLYNKENKYFYYYQPQIDDLIWITNDASEFLNKFMTVKETRNILLHEKKFNKVCSNIGYLKYNEVYILVPWIMLGGYDKIENYTVGNLFVYLDLVSQTLMKKMTKKDSQINMTKDEITAELNKFENFGIGYINLLKKAYLDNGFSKKWNDIEENAFGISDDDRNNLLKEYPKTPKSFLEILNKIDGTHFRIYGSKKLNYYFFSSDVSNGEYPYFLLSAEQILNSKNNALDYYDYLISRDYEDIPVSNKITNNKNNVKWLHFADCMNNGGTSQLYIDFTPSENGKIGQVIRYLHDPDELEVIADSFDDFLVMIIENGFKFLNVYK